jgi:hypothetical protein
MRSRRTAEILAVLEHDVEHAVIKTRGCVESILQQLEPRDAMLVECDELAVDHGVKRKDDQITDLSKRFGETQTLLGAMQRMLAPLLRQPDPFGQQPDNREARDAQT